MKKSLSVLLAVLMIFSLNMITPRFTGALTSDEAALRGIGGAGSAEASDDSATCNTYTPCDIASIRFYAARDLYPGEGVSCGLAAEVTFDDGWVFNYDFLYDYDSFFFPQEYDVRQMLTAFFFDKNVLFYESTEVAGAYGETVVSLELRTAGVTWEGEPVGSIAYQDRVTLNVVENPVDYLEILGDNPTLYTGWKRDYEIEKYDPDTDAFYTETYRAFGSYEPQDIVIHYTDGTVGFLSEMVDWSGYCSDPFDGCSYSEYLYYDLPFDGAEAYGVSRQQIEYISDQYLRPWAGGASYPVTVRYMGREATYYVDVIDGLPASADETEPTIRYSDYYLTGSFCLWDVNQTYRMIRTDNDNCMEYFVGGVYLSDTDGFKAIYVPEEGGDWEWYPDGTGNALTVDTSGYYDIWFRPNGDGDGSKGWRCTPSADGSDSEYCFRVVPFCEPASPDGPAEPTEPSEPASPDAPTEPPEPSEPATESPSDLPAPAAMLGDADGDGRLTLLDVTVIQRCLACFTVRDLATVARCGDVNGNGLDILDAALIQRYFAGFTVPYPIGSAMG